MSASTIHRQKKVEIESDRDTTACSDLDPPSKSLGAPSDSINYAPPDAIIFQRKTSSLKLLPDQVIDIEEEQTSKVEMDLFKGIFQMAKSNQVAAISGLLGAFMIHLIVGAIYRWNMITSYVAMYYNTSEQTPVGAPLSMFCAGLTMRVGFKLSNTYGSAITMGVALIIAIVSVMISSRMQTFPYFLLFNNVLYGLSAGLLFLPPLKECHFFFPNLKLVINSIVLAGTGLGAVLFGSYNIECIQNKEDLYSYSDEQVQSLIDSTFSFCMIKMGFLVLLVGGMGIGMMVPMIWRNEQRIKQQSAVAQDDKTGNFCASESQSFKSRVFWMIAAIIFLSSCGNYYVITNFRNLLAVEYRKKPYLYWLLISGALGNGLSRLIWGFSFSRVGFKTLFCVAAGMNLASFVLIMGTSDPTIYFVFYTLNSISLGGFMVIFPNVAQLIFGKRIGGTIYSYYWLVFAMGNFFQFAITLVLTNNPTSGDDYGEVLFFFTLCVIGSIVIVCRQKLQGSWNNSLDLIEFKRTSNRKYSS